MTSAKPQTKVPLPLPVATKGTARWLWLLGGGGVAGLLVLYFFSPTEHTFYPTCQFYQLTSLHCPGCGSLRALHQLTHGHFIAAFLSNPLLITALPVLAWMGFRQLRPARPQCSKQLLVQPAVVWIMFGIVLAFGILRNLPWPAFAWMSP